MAKNNRPDFGKVLIGYNKKYVEDYISKLESELEIANFQKEKQENELENSKKSLERVQTQLDNAWSDRDMLRNQNEKLNEKIKELERVIQEQGEQLDKADLEIKRIKQENLESGNDPHIIQEAILSAQRISKVIVEEANQEAETIRNRANDEYSIAKQKMENMIQEKNQEMEMLIMAAENKCCDLHEEYDRILMDVSGFKAEMISLYRKHLELLYKLPDNGRLEIPAMDEVTLEEE